MRNALRWLLSPAVIGTIGLLVLSALVWWAFPLVAFGSVRPFDGFWVRVVTLVVLWALWLAWLGWAWWRRRQTHAALVKGLSAGSAASQREAEVLLWVAQGKSNLEIANILGAAENTIKVHLRHLFEKLGADNRHALTFIALEKLAV